MIGIVVFGLFVTGDSTFPRDPERNTLNRENRGDRILTIEVAVRFMQKEVVQGEYSVFVAECNLGIDQNSLGEEGDLTDVQLAKRKDLEWYRIFLVPGKPAKMGKIKDL